MPTFAARNQRFCIMEATGTRRKRTREEILEWLAAARQRKAAWEKEVKEEFAERERQRKIAAESGYYDLEWV